LGSVKRKSTQRKNYGGKTRLSQTGKKRSVKDKEILKRFNKIG